MAIAGSQVSKKKEVNVAVGVVVNGSKQVLIALRSPEQHMGGLWEFPGGKIESDESVVQALSRELIEEIGIDPTATEPLVQIDHDYPDKRVSLNVHWVRTLTGEPKGLEGQEVRWVSSNELNNYEFPEANLEIVRRVRKALG